MADYISEHGIDSEEALDYMPPTAPNHGTE
jgi:hypothetical protein